MARKGFWQQLQRERISRRRLLGASGAGAAGLAALAVSRNGRVTAAADPVPTRGGRYQDVAFLDWGTLDPLVSVGGATSVFPRLYNVLVNRSSSDPDFWYFDLANEVEQPTEDTYSFGIRPGVKIAPNDLGVPERDMDAFDATAWLDRIIQDQAALLRAFANEWLASYEAPNSETFTVRTTGPYGYFFFRFGAPMGGTIPPREFSQQGISLSDGGVGAGPFVVQPGSYHERGDLSLNRNTNYYRTDPDNNGAQLPYVDGIDYIRITDRLARRTAFIEQHIHAYGAESREEVDELLGILPDLQVFEEPVNSFISFVMNPNRPPWNDLRIRKAALYALDRQEFVDRIVGPGNGYPNGLVPWTHGPFALTPEELEELQPYDPARSRSLIYAATGEETVAINVIYSVGVDLQFLDQHLPIFLQQMGEAGFDVQEQPLDFGTWLAWYWDVDYDASLSLNQTYDTAEIPLDWHSSAGPQGDGHYAVGIGALYPEVDAAILESKGTTDPAEQVSKVWDAQRLIYEVGPAFLPIMSWIGFTLRHDFVRNWPRGLGDTALFLNDWWLQGEWPPTATPPVPTATVGAGVLAPDTGAGSGASGRSAPAWLIGALTGFGLAAAAGYGALRARERRG